MLQDARLRISSQNWGENSTEKFNSETVWTHTCTHTSTETQILNSYLACPQHLTIACLPSLYNFTPINLTHLITVPPPQPQRSHILHTPLPPFWAQPQLWNPTANNSVTCSVPLDFQQFHLLLTLTLFIIQNSKFCPFWDTEEQTTLLSFSHSCLLFDFLSAFLICAHVLFFKCKVCQDMFTARTHKRNWHSHPGIGRSCQQTLG